MKRSKIHRKMHLVLMFIGIIFFILVLTMLLMGFGFAILNKLGFTKVGKGHIPFLLFAVVSVIVGSIVAGIFSRVPLAPIRKLIDATDALAKGDFTARIDIKGPGELQKLNDSFNHMAEELNSIEVLRTDFVNNFSHEFKTPIVSIRGFAKILKDPNLPAAQREEYLDIIISESERLAELATNTLSLSKIENQNILIDTTQFNLTEQIRRAITLLEDQWDRKQLQMNLDAEEVDIVGNQEYLKQVWINLIDNAIKFAPVNSSVEISVRKRANMIHFLISNHGEPLNEETAKHIFDKFYQGDTSHATKGNGLGLSLVRKIIELHEGNIRLVVSNSHVTSFEAILPAQPASPLSERNSRRKSTKNS